jgi:acetophenone carboxylase
MHCTWHLMKASLGVYLFTYFFRGLPPNIGLLEPLTMLIEGPSVANCGEELAHGEGTTISAIVVQNLHVIGSKMLFDSPGRLGVCAPFARNPLLNVFSGINQFGYRTANFSGVNNARGQGARFDKDAEHANGFFWASVTDAGETEEMDMRLPTMTLARRIDRDFHGFGKFRGGSPLVEISMAPLERGCQLTSWGSADRISQNPGLFGGYAAPPNPRFVIRNSDFKERMARGEMDLDLTQYSLAHDRPLNGEYVFEESSQTTQTYQPGDIFVYSGGGGGGYGDVLEREPSQVMDDLRAEILSEDVARNLYRVEFDPVTLEADPEATAASRQRAREERKQRGKPFTEFMKEWSALKPSDDLLKYYGHWPEPRLEHYDKPFWGQYE